MNMLRVLVEAARHEGNPLLKLSNTMKCTWPAGSCTVSSSKIVMLLHTMEGPYIDI